MKRGAVVLVRFPYADGQRGKNRPSLIIQNDRDNRRLANTIIPMITGNTRHADELSQVLIDPRSPEGQSSGLHGPSVVKCCNVFTIRQNDIIRTLGQLSDMLLDRVNTALKEALSLP